MLFRASLMADICLWLILGAGALYVAVTAYVLDRSEKDFLGEDLRFDWWWTTPRVKELYPFLARTGKLLMILVYVLMALLMIIKISSYA